VWKIVWDGNKSLDHKRDLGGRGLRQQGVRVHNIVFTTINKGNINGEGSDDTDN
jgi:hypothetical protein